LFLLIFLLLLALLHGVITVLSCCARHFVYIYCWTLVSVIFERKIPVSVIDYYYLQTDPANASASQINREEVDARSIFVGNVSCLFPCFC
jgi:hypothetical protein